MNRLDLPQANAPAPPAEMLARQHHRADCPGCSLCLTGDCKIDRSYPDAPDLDCVGRTLRAGT